MPLAHPCVSATRRNGAIIFDPEDLRAPATQQTLEPQRHVVGPTKMSDSCFYLILHQFLYSDSVNVRGPAADIIHRDFFFRGEDKQ